MGQFALVDAGDYDDVSKYKWRSAWDEHTHSFYAIREHRDSNYGTFTLSMHRFIMGCTKGDGTQVDHINHNTLDNRRCNLRVVNQSKNQHNRRNVRGYYLNKRSKKYVAQFNLNGKRYILGYFKTAIEAREAYLERKQYV